MRVLCASDIHEFHYLPSEIDPRKRIERYAKNVLKVLKEEKIDLYLNAGDFPSSEFAMSFLNKIKTKTFVVIGNRDWNLKFENKYVKILNCGLEKYRDYHILCLGIGPPEDLERVLMPLKKIDPKKLILLSHLPPYGILDVVYSGHHTGEIGLRQFLEEAKPILHVFGHIHEAAGVQKFKETLAINSAVELTGIAYIVEFPYLKVKKVNLKE